MVLKLKLDKPRVAIIECKRCGKVFAKKFTHERLSDSRFLVKCPGCRGFIHIGRLEVGENPWARIVEVREVEG